MELALHWGVEGSKGSGLPWRKLAFQMFQAAILVNWGGNDPPNGVGLWITAVRASEVIVSIWGFTGKNTLLIHGVIVSWWWTWQDFGKCLKCNTVEAVRKMIFCSDHVNHCKIYIQFLEKINEEKAFVFKELGIITIFGMLKDIYSNITSAILCEIVP